MNVMRIVALLLAGTTLAAAQIIPGQYIAVFKDQVRQPPAAAQAAAAQHGLAVAHVYQHAIKGFAFAGSPQAVAALSRRADIAYIEPDQVYHAWQQALPTGISRAAVDQVWLGDATTGQWLINNHPAPALDVDIAILDTGISTSHPDLNVIGGQRFYVQGVRLRQDTNYNDDNGHGSHVAGTAAAIDNGLGVVGVAPGARLWAVKVLDRNGSGSLSGVIAGVDWVTARAGTIEVANMSLGGGYSQAINDAVKRGTEAGIVFVVAAGNSNADSANYSPASEPTAITVSALADQDGSPGGLGSATSYGPDDSLASFSNYGSAVDIAAPGVDILSTYLGSGYATASGTSMASPHVAGAAALYMAGMSPRPSVAEVTAALLGSGWTAADTCCYFSGDRDIYPEPLLNVAELMGTGVVEPPTDMPPSVSITSPANGEVVSGTISLSTLASDDDGVTQVEFYANGISIGLGAYDTISGLWQLDWDTALVEDGIYLLTAQATDTADNTSLSPSVSVSVNNNVVDPTNQAPASSFTYSAAGLTVQFTDTSTDSDGAIASWAWNFGDGTTSTQKNPSRTYAAGGTFNVSLTVTDDDGATSSSIQSVTVTAPSSNPINLIATGYKVRGRQQVDLTWSGAAGASVTIYRNNLPLVDTDNDGSHTDAIGAVGGGTYIYRIVDGSGSESNSVTVVF